MKMKNMTGTRARNHYVAAPAGTAPSERDRISPTFACGALELFEMMRETALAQPRTKMLSQSPEELHMVLVQRTKFWRFPDDISVEIIALEDGGATLMLSSKARYGVEDFSVNRRRVERWLTALEACAANKT